MITSVVIGNKRHLLRKEDVIGEGGEAVIFKLGKKALKVYRSPSKQRERKLKAFFRESFFLPSNVFYPLELAFDGKGRVIGFTMNKLKAGCDPVAVLGNKKYCAQSGITTKVVANLFLDIYKSLIGIHKTGIIVGDFNDRNEVIDLTYQKVAWIDVDSWQWKSHPCIVATEAFLSPDLYGLDLRKELYFKEEHDWFSFAVLLFRSLLRIHPFRAGIHPKYKSLMARAEKGITVLDSDVRYPTIGLSPDVLSDEFIDVVVDYLKRRRKDPFPLNCLEQYLDILVECPSCGLWYAGIRKLCPGCQMKNIVDMRLKQMLAGCECEILISTPGKIILFQVAGKTIYCLTDEGGTTYLYKRSNGDKVVRKEMFNSRPGARFGLFDGNLVVCANPADEEPALFVLNIDGSKPRPVLKTVTKSIAGGKAVFACSSKYLYRIVGSRIMRGEIFGKSNQLLEREMGQSLQEQTWFTVSPNPSRFELLMGFYRVFGDFKWFLIKGENQTSFKRFEVDLPKLSAGESLIDLSVKFSNSSVLVLRKTRKKGVDNVRVDIVSGSDGSITCSYVSKISDAEHYENIHGRAFKKGIIVHPTSKGIVYEKADNQESNVLIDSDQFISSGDALYAYKDDIIVVTEDRVLLIKPKKRR